MSIQSRRNFLKNSAALSASSVLAFRANYSPRVHAGENNTLKLGIVGCGGRGCGAVGNALDADPVVELVAAADVFPERGKNGVAALK